MLMPGSSTLCQGPQDAWWPSNPVLLQMSLLYLGLLSTICSFYLRLTESENSGSTGVETVLEEVLLTRAASDLIENSSTILVGLSDSGGVLPTAEPPASISVSSTSIPPSDELKKPVPPAPIQNATSQDEQQPHDDIPSFSEWAKKQMAEAEKNKGENLTVGTVKVRLKNYASPDCGAKVVASNPESLSPGAILSPSRDDYMLNACNVKIWFVVELCEAIQPQRIEIANFELFSSSPKEFSIFVSDRFPTRDWSLVKSITAKDERTVQNFPLPQLSHFAKYVKVELHSHYGTEHYCPISLFKAYGTSELEVLDNVDNDDNDNDEEVIHHAVTELFDEDEDVIGSVETRYRTPVNGNNGNIKNDGTVKENNGKSTTESDDSTGTESGNILGSAKAAVFSLVQKAVLVVKGGEKNITSDGEDVNEAGKEENRLMKYCVSPAYLIVCTNCTDDFYNRVFEYLSCSGYKLKEILSNNFIYRSLLNTRLCADIGLNFGRIIPSSVFVSPVIKAKTTVRDPQYRILDYFQSFFKPELTASLCNYLAITERKVHLNISHPEEIIEDKTPEISVIPISDELESLDKDSEKSEVIVELKTVEPPVPEKTLADSISPTKTLPPINDDLSVIVNDSKHSLDRQQYPGLDNSSTSKVNEEITISTSSPVVLPSIHTVMTSQQPTPITSINIKESAVENETVPRIETQVPLPQLQSTIQSVPVVQEEVVDPLASSSDPLASLFPELDEESTSESSSTTAKSSTASQSITSSTTQKETVFVRLANRIKALEVNMSLSGQYLEELSRRYKKQVEELQRTLSNMVEERRLANERETLQAAQINALNAKMDALTSALAELISEKDKVSMIGQHGVIIVVEVVVFLIVLAICRWIGAAKSTSSRASGKVANHQHHLVRRHSMDNVDGPAAPKIRRPSEEACIPSGNTHKELLVDDSVKRKTSREGTRRRKRRRKDRWEDEGIVIVGPDSEEPVTSVAVATSTASSSSTKWEPVSEYSSEVIVPHNQDYNVKTALWSRAKRTSHTQTSSSQETLNSLQTQNYNHSSTASSTTNTSTSTVSKPKKSSSGGAIKKIVKKFF
ncbi:hypothetical protein O3M35_004911 [Rhynocoris fuscipes]|uniref:SUN domain-containing protein n=1 Tax=Rhynocoris fuscipes TaxID=488301 RepID=A0AAW1DIJ4_9HEMI